MSEHAKEECVGPPCPVCSGPQGYSVVAYNPETKRWCCSDCAETPEGQTHLGAPGSSHSVDRGEGTTQGDTTA